MSEIHDAIINGDIDTIIRLLDKKKNLINETDDDGNTPLHHALIKMTVIDDPDKLKKYLNIINELLQREGLKLNVKNNKNNTIVQIFSQSLYGHEFSDYLHLAKLIIDSDEHHMVALFHNAIYAHNLDMVKFLLSQNDRLIHEKDARGFSPYIIAVAASAENVERFFYENYPEVVVNESKLDLDLSTPKSTSTIIKAAFTYEKESHRATLEKIIDELYGNPEFRPTLDLVAASLVEQRSKSNKPVRIFIANSDNIKNLTPKSTGYGDFDIVANILRLGGSRDREDIKGTLIHEFTHLAALIVYSNGSKPFKKDSKEETKYKRAIEDMYNLFITQVEFHPIESLLSKLLIIRIEKYRSQEEKLNKEKGSLSEPEWIVSIPQAFVLYASFYIDGQRSLIESHGQPMLEYWRYQFNDDVRAAFDAHPMKQFVDTMIASDNPETPKVILSTTADLIMESLMSKRFELDAGSMVDGYNEGHGLQFKIINRLLIGKVLDNMFQTCELPPRFNLSDAKEIAQHPIFRSQEYKDAYQNIYNALTKIWIKKGKPQDFTLSSLDAHLIDGLKKLIDPTLGRDIRREVIMWGNNIQTRYSDVHQCEATLLENITEGKSVNKKDLAKLRRELVAAIYLNWPAQHSIPQQELADILAAGLIKSKIIKPSTVSFINKSSHSIKLDEKLISACVQGCVNDCLKSLEAEKTYMMAKA